MIYFFKSISLRKVFKQNSICVLYNLFICVQKCSKCFSGNTNSYNKYARDIQEYLLNNYLHDMYNPVGIILLTNLYKIVCNNI